MSAKFGVERRYRWLLYSDFWFLGGKRGGGWGTLPPPVTTTHDAWCMLYMPRCVVKGEREKSVEVTTRNIYVLRMHIRCIKCQVNGLISSLTWRWFCHFASLIFPRRYIFPSHKYFATTYLIHNWRRMRSIRIEMRLGCLGLWPDWFRLSRRVFENWLEILFEIWCWRYVSLIFRQAKAIAPWVVLWERRKYSFTYSLIYFTDQTPR